MSGKYCSIRERCHDPYLEPKTVVAIVSGHLKGNRNYTTAIDKLLTLELVDRLFVDQ